MRHILIRIVNSYHEAAFEKVRKDFRSNKLDDIPALQVAIDSTMREKNLIETALT